MLRKCFSNPKIVHIIRDGRDVVRSWLNKGKYAPTDQATRLTAEDVDGDSHSDEWNNMNPLEKASWEWTVVNQTIENSDPDLTVFFEELFLENNERIFDILNLMDDVEYDKSEVLDQFSRKRNATKNPLIPRGNEWPETWRKQFQKLAGGLMEKYDYNF
jgi:hypothetical protein